jgi:uncharacterized protein (TIGR00255 family)
MIYSMTGFGVAESRAEFGAVTIEIRSVNSRYLDLQFRLPDELRLIEQPIRERISSRLKRGKVDIRASFTRATTEGAERLNPELIAEAVKTFASLKEHLPDLAAPTLADLLTWPSTARVQIDPAQWLAPALHACDGALNQALDARAREGQRLAQVMLEASHQAAQIATELSAHLPNLLQNQRDKSAQKLRESLEQVFPDGFSQIGGEELSARLATEASIFALRVDVAEELDRLNSHIQELHHLLSDGAKNQSLGKRLDFLFQEMNREANTLGSKSGHLNMTRTAIDLKLLIEQMREQAQNIE